MHDVFVRNKLRERQSSAEIENSWEISYGDMITLLLAFFVMFFNIKTETMNMQLIKKDIDKYFSEKTDKRSPTAQAEAKDIKGEQKTNLPIISSQVQNSLKIKSNIQGQNVLVDFPGVEFFKSGRVDLTHEGQTALKEFTAAISNHLGSFRLVVRGFTDNKPLKHSRFKDNLELSAARSISAIRFMNKQGIGTHYMRIAGYGETDGARDMAQGEAAMRRISIVLEPLEHAEKNDTKASGKDTRDKKAIEDVAKAKVEGSPILKAAEVEHPMTMYLKDIKNIIAAVGLQEKYDTLREPASYARWIERQDLYQKWITQWVIHDLKARGYSDQDIQRMIQKTELKTNEKQGYVP